MTNNSCENCNLLASANTQYEKVVEQNKSLQTECKKLKAENERLILGQASYDYELDNATDIADLYKQALKKIEEIVTPVEYPEVDRCINFGNVCHTQILDIINEAKEVEKK